MHLSFPSNAIFNDKLTNTCRHDSLRNVLMDKAYGEFNIYIFSTVFLGPIRVYVFLMGTIIHLDDYYDKCA